MTQQRFVYFYTTPPFWVAAEKPAFCSLMPSEAERLPEQMSALVLECEIVGTQIRIYYDGLIELHRNDLDAEIYPPSGIIRNNTKVSDAYGEYLRIINALFVCLDIGCMEATCSSPFRFEEITRRDIARSTYVDGRHRSSEIATNSMGGYYLFGRFPDSFKAKRPMSEDPRFYQRCILSPETIAVGLKHFESVCAKSTMIDKLAMFAKALSEFNGANYATSVVLCWFLLERTLNERYKAYLNAKASSGQHCVDAKRKKIITGRNFTAAITTQVLAREGIIDAMELHRLNTIRKQRNGIAHHLTDELPTSRDCEAALDFTFKFMLADVIDQPRVCLFWQLREHWPHWATQALLEIAAP